MLLQKYSNLLFLVLSTFSSVSCDLLARPAFSLELSNSTVAENGDYDYESSSNNTISKRTDVLDCSAKVAIVFAAFFSGASAAAAWYPILKKASKTVHKQSEDHNCGIVHHTQNKMRFTYTSSGRNCDTTAQQETIQGALDKAYRNYVHNDYNGIWCMDLTHGGNWVGYLLVGPDGPELWNNLSCGNNNSGRCVKGGKNDVHH